MAGTFFNSWALWQKMVFILACCLVLTIFAGLIKLWYTHYRKRRYAALEKLADTVQIIREKSIIRSLSTKKVKTPRRHSVRRQDQPPIPPMVEVPFGIRALEEGAQVEDVWDSRPNSRDTSRVDIYRQSNTSTTDLVHADRKDPASRDLSGLTAATESSNGTLMTDHTVQDLSPTGMDKDAYARSRYPPHSFARYEGTRNHRTTNSFSRRRQEMPQPDGVQTSHSASTFLSTTSNGGSDSETGMPEYQMRQKSRSRRSQPSSIRSSSADSISAMQQRRLSQCAETGQILPRLRSDALGSESSADMYQAQTPRHQRRMSFEMSDSGEDSDTKHFKTPTLPATGSSPGVEDSPASKTERISRKMKRLKRRSTPANSTPSSPTTPSSTFAVPERQDSDVLRQVNPGFAVLKPGSLESSPVRPPTDGATQSRASSVESSRKGRRLQKKRTSQDSSRGGA